MEGENMCSEILEGVVKEQVRELDTHMRYIKVAIRSFLTLGDSFKGRQMYICTGPDMTVIDAWYS